MAEYLLFQLTAAMGAMGEFGGHERRGSLTWPGRSALIGLMGAALGLRRGADFSALDQLSLAVAIFDPGLPLRDYHTVETIPDAAAKAPQSRPEALALARAAGKSNTTITLRDYRAGPVYGVAVWGGALSPLAKALRRPVFTLYLGRKSCPLSAPLAPALVQAARPEAALAQLRLPAWLPQEARTARLMACDDHPDAAHRETRHDRALDRAKWHFGPREVAMVPVEITAEVAR